LEEQVHHTVTRKIEDMKKLIYGLALMPISANAGGMAAGSDRELAYVYIAIVALIGIFVYVNRILKNYWTKPDAEEEISAKKPK